jgi:hypothetical protein
MFNEPAPEARRIRVFRRPFVGACSIGGILSRSFAALHSGLYSFGRPGLIDALRTADANSAALVPGYIGLVAPKPRIDSTRSRVAKASGALRNRARWDALVSGRPDSRARNNSRSLSGSVASELSA